MDDLIAHLAARLGPTGAVVLVAIVAFAAVWVAGLGWFLIIESHWFNWWFRMSRADRKAYRRVFGG